MSNANKKIYLLGIDIGSTTVKSAIIDERNRLLFADYRRHFANIQGALADILSEAKKELGAVNIVQIGRAHV